MICNHKCTNVKDIHNRSCKLPSQLDCRQIMKIALSQLVKQNKQISHVTHDRFLTYDLTSVTCETSAVLLTLLSPHLGMLITFNHHTGAAVQIHRDCAAHRKGAVDDA